MASLVRSPAEGKGTEGYLLPETLISRPSNRKRGPTKDGGEGLCKVGFRFESYIVVCQADWSEPKLTSVLNLPIDDVWPLSPNYWVLTTARWLGVAYLQVFIASKLSECRWRHSLNEKSSESPIVDVGICQLSDSPIQSDPSSSRNTRDKARKKPRASGSGPWTEQLVDRLCESVGQAAYDVVWFMKWSNFGSGAMSGA